MRSLKVLLALILLITLSLPTFAQQLSDKAQVSLLTCGPGNELYSVFGHTAIRVHDPQNRIDAVYNYGTFDFSTPNFYLKFIKGDLQYYVSVSSYEDFVTTYMYYNRDVYEQRLNLSQAQKQGIYNELNDVLLSDRRFYTYKFIDRNCTTMAGDVIDAATEGTISLKNSNNGKTYRKIIYEYLDHHFYESLGINLIFGYKTDRLSNTLFLPQELLEGVNNTVINGVPLAQKPVTVYKSTPQDKTSLWNNYYTFLAAMLLLLVFSHRRTVYMSYLALSGLLGVFFCTVGYYSLHNEVTQNYNALLINPLFLLLVFLIIKKNTKWTAIISWICLALLAVYLLFMLNKPHLLMVLPIAALNAAILIRQVKAGRKLK